MIRWRAVVPLKGIAARKTRLAGVLTPEQRQRLSQAMFRHVVRVLEQAEDVSSVVVLSDRRPEGYEGDLVHDRGRGLNAELAAARATLGGDAMAVIHADLPLLDASDVASFLAAAASGCAVAPDRHGLGTNALALIPTADFTFEFGPGSLKRHATQNQAKARLVPRPRLGLDVDTAEDLALAVAAGWSWS